MSDEKTQVHPQEGKRVFKDLETFTVKRSDWLRGKGSSYSGLLRDGKMCCLGFYSKAQGFTNEELEHASSPGELVRHTNALVDSKLAESSARFGAGDTARGCNLMTINDDSTMKDFEREEILTKKFAELGIKVEFVD